MFKAVRDYMGGHSAVWDGIVANVNAYNLLSARITEIDGLVARQERNLGGITADKAAVRKVLEQKVLIVANAAASYAVAVGNNTLLAEVDYSPTDLSTLSEQRIDDVAARVKEIGETNLLALGDYGVTSDDNTAIGDAIDEYEVAKTAPDVARAERSGMTETLAPLVSETGKLLREQMDKLMARYETESPEYHAGYEAARVVIDLRGPGDGGDPEPDPEP